MNGSCLSANQRLQHFTVDLCWLTSKDVLTTVQKYFEFVMALQGKVAIITGASSGIGAGIAKCFAAEGALLSLTGRRKENLEAVVKTIPGVNPNSVLTTIGDITDKTTREALVRRTKDKFGKIDILVNNAGMSHLCPLEEETEEAFDALVNINLKAPVFLTKLLVPHLKETKGSVVNISTVGSIRPVSPAGIYSATKAGLNLYSTMLAAELGPAGVRVNTVLPGLIEDTDLLRDTGLGKDSLQKLSETFVKSVPLGRNGTAKDIGKTVVYLASDNASFITGQMLNVDGGWSQFQPAI